MKRNSLQIKGRQTDTSSGIYFLPFSEVSNSNHYCKLQLQLLEQTLHGANVSLWILLTRNDRSSLEQQNDWASSAFGSKTWEFSFTSMVLKIPYSSRQLLKINLTF